MSSACSGSTVRCASLPAARGTSAGRSPSCWRRPAPTSSLNYLSNDEPAPKRRPALAEAFGSETLLVKGDVGKAENGAARGRRGDQALRQARHPGQQRRQDGRQPAHPHVGRGVGQRHRDQPAQHLPLHSRRPAPDAAPALRPHHQHHAASTASSATPARPTTRPPRRARSASRARWRARWPAAASR